MYDIANIIYGIPLKTDFEDCESVIDETMDFKLFKSNYCGSGEGCYYIGHRIATVPFRTYDFIKFVEETKEKANITDHQKSEIKQLLNQLTKENIEELGIEDLGYCFVEMRDLSPDCKFRGCTHVHEPGCAVLQALANGELEKSRHDHYLLFLSEMKEKKRRY